MEDFDDDDVVFSDDPGSDELEQDSDGDSGSEEAPSQDGEQKADEEAGPRPVVPDEQLNEELSSQAALLQLQVNELLAEVRASTNDARPGKLVAQLKHLLQEVPEQQVSSDCIKGFLESLGLPAELSMPFHPPASVTLVGSYALGTAALPELTVDVALELPRACLHEKDQLNYRYHSKRAMYLATVARHLVAQPAFSQQRFSFQQGDPCRPVLELAAGGKGAAALKLRLLPCLSPSAFAASKLAPDRNNVRWAVPPAAAAAAAAAAAKAAAGAAAAPAAAAGPGSEAAARTAGEASTSGREQQQAQAQQAPALLLPTPYYNSAVLQDMLLLHHQALLQQALRKAPRLADAVLLLKVWARQQQLHTPPAGFCGCLLTWLLLHVTHTNPVAAAMSPVQLFRATLLLMQTLGKGLQLAAPPGAPPSPLPASAPSAEAFRRQQPVVLLDPTGWCNLAAGVSRSFVTHAAGVAKRTVALLDQQAGLEQAFTQVFLTPAQPAASFDYVWRVELPQQQQQGLQQAADVAAVRQQELQVEVLVRQALTDRAQLVRALPRQPAACASLEEGDFESVADLPVVVGARVDPLLALRLVDVGPAADDAKGAAKFRRFWGDKSELRRFQDGKISEALVWGAGPGQRHAVPDMAVRHVLARHLPGSEASCSAGLLDAALVEREVDAAASLQASRAADAAFEALSKRIRTLSDLALKVTTVQPLSATLRHTAPFFPQPHPLAGGPAAGAGLPSLPRCLAPLDLMVQLEGSGKWPDAPAAYSKMKAALGCQVAQALEAGAGVRCIASEAYVEVLYEGYAFRLHLTGDRDQAVAQQLQQAGQQAGQQQQGPPPLALSWHHGLVSSIEGVNAAFGPAARLAQRWVGCHLMSSQLCDEAVELLVAAAFSSAGLQAVPGSRLAGFLRFLQLLAQHRWQQHPLLVDPAAEMSAAQRAKVHVAFEARRREASGGPAMYLATPKDPGSQQWTDSKPDRPALQHLASLAAQAAAQLQQLLLPPPAGSSSLADPDLLEEQALAALFAPDLSDFDLLIQLRKEALPQAGRALQLPGSSGSSSSSRHSSKRSRSTVPPDELSELLSEVVPPPKRARAVLRAFPEHIVASKPQDKLASELLVGFDPVKHYVRLLEARYGHLATFCADYHGGVAIGVRWRPGAFVPKQARKAVDDTCLHTAMQCPVGKVAVPNVVAVVAEMAQLGVGLVADVQHAQAGGSKLLLLLRGK